MFIPVFPDEKYYILNEMEVSELHFHKIMTRYQLEIQGGFWTLTA